MKYRRLRHSVALIGLTMLFFSLFCVVGVEATANNTTTTLAHKTPIAFNFTNAPDGNFDKSWTSAHGKILHMRGAPHNGTAWGDLEGNLTYVGDIELDPITGDGTGGGTVYFSVNYGSLFGTFEGRMVIKVEGWYIAAKFICHGGGDFEGMHLKGTAGGYMFPGVYLANAVILNPHG